MQHLVYRLPSYSTLVTPRDSPTHMLTSQLVEEQMYPHCEELHWLSQLVCATI